MATVAVIPDLHCHMQHRDAFAFIEAVAERVGPTRWVNLGDEADFHAISRWPKALRAENALKELELTRKELVKLARVVGRDMDICKSNHTQRPERLAAEAGIPEEFLMPKGQLLQTPKGWNWHKEIVIDDVAYEHGDKLSSGRPDAVITECMRSTVYGHVHTQFGVSWKQTRSSVIFAATPGCLIDEEQYGFEYGAGQKRRPQLGMAIVKDGDPYLVRMHLKPGGRWDGKVRLP